MRPAPLFQNHRGFSSFFRQIDLQDLYITLGSGLDAVQDQYQSETGRRISVYPVEVLADCFEPELDLYYKRLAKFLKDPKYFDEENQIEIEEFLDNLRNSREAYGPP